MRIDDVFMEEVGLNEMPDGERQAFMDHAEEELEVRVGHAVSQELSAQQLKDFEEIEEGGQAAAWLKINVPNFREIVQTVVQSFKNELIAERTRILE